MKSNLLILHGALGSSVQFEPLAKILEEEFRVILFNFTGHGGKPIPDEPFSIKMFAEEVKSLIEKSRISPCDIFGYSMGGYAALYAAKHYPGIIGKIFTLGTKFDWNEETSAREVKMLNPTKLEEKVSAFARILQERHSPENWKLVMSKTAEMMINLGKHNELTYEELGSITNEVTVAVGDRDNMVSTSETESAFKSLTNGRMLVVPGTEHPIEKVETERLVNEVTQFFV